MSQSTSKETESNTQPTVIELIEETQLTPAEALDYQAVVFEGYTQSEWAAQRGLDGHQSVGRNVRNAREKLDPPENKIITVRVDPQHIINAIWFNEKPKDAWFYGTIGDKDKDRAVIQIDPPFGHTVDAITHYIDETDDKDAGSPAPDPIRIPPKSLVNDDEVLDVPDRAEERDRAEQNFRDPEEDIIEDAVDECYSIWRQSIRDNIVDEVDISDFHDTNKEPFYLDVVVTDR
jgi:hypothetical protein